VLEAGDDEKCGDRGGGWIANVMADSIDGVKIHRGGILAEKRKEKIYHGAVASSFST
jgi:hypothetical protein